MSVKIIPEGRQGYGQFNGGAILENKPIGFPQDGGEGKPFSNLFYWAHAWTPAEKSLIGEHPHQGFEIMSFVLKGSIEHYDSKQQGWKKLEEGDAQIIRAGNGITHAELVNDESEFFQIWLDPNLDVTLGKPASYNDYKSSDIPIVKEGGYEVKVYSGADGIMEMDSKNVVIKEYRFPVGSFELPFDSNAAYGAYLISGDLAVDGEQLQVKDFAIIGDTESVKVEVKADSRWFVIQSPATLDYLTYVERMQQHFQNQ